MIKWRVAGHAVPAQGLDRAADNSCRHDVELRRAGGAARHAQKRWRAVGHANGSNPISVVVPCHRVIGADGSLTGYGRRARAQAMAAAARRRDVESRIKTRRLMAA